MEDYRKIVTYKFNKELAKHDMSFIQLKLSNIDGINSIEVSPKSVTVDYVTLKLADESVKEIFKGIGYPISSEKKKRPRIFRRFINNLAASNKETFGDQRLDCCDLKHKN